MLAIFLLLFMVQWFLFCALPNLKTPIWVCYKYCHFISGVFNVIKLRSIPVMSLSTLLSCYQNHFPYLCCSAPLLGSTGCQFGKLNIPKAIFITLGLHISIIIFPFFDANSSSTLQCCKLLQWAHHWWTRKQSITCIVLQAWTWNKCTLAIYYQIDYKRRHVLGHWSKCASVI